MSFQSCIMTLKCCKRVPIESVITTTSSFSMKAERHDAS